MYYVGQGAQNQKVVGAPRERGLRTLPTLLDWWFVATPEAAYSF